MTDIDADARVREMLANSNAPDWQAGSSEPWVADVLAALAVANDSRTLIEVGGFQGFTSKRIVRALAKLRYECAYIVCEIDPQRAKHVRDILKLCAPLNVDTFVDVADSHEWIPTLADTSVDFAWLDGNHEKAHVAREIELLLPKMAPGGIICGHDTFGVCDLAEVFAHFGGYSIDLPRLGPAGGIGVLQRPR